MSNFSVSSIHLMKLITKTILPFIFFTSAVFGQSSHNYKVVIDNCHSSISNEATNNTITVEFMNGNKVIEKTSKKGIKDCSTKANFTIQCNERITGGESIHYRK
jgi:hypothetical protein